MQTIKKTSSWPVMFCNCFSLDITPPTVTFKPIMKSTVKGLCCAGLLLDIFRLDIDFQSISQPTFSEPPHRPLSCKIPALYNNIQLVLRKPNSTLFCREIFKMATKSTFVFHYFYSVKTFLHNLMGNKAFKGYLMFRCSVFCPC